MYSGSGERRSGTRARQLRADGVIPVRRIGWGTGATVMVSDSTKRDVAVAESFRPDAAQQRSACVWLPPCIEP